MRFMLLLADRKNFDLRLNEVGKSPVIPFRYHLLGCLPRTQTFSLSVYFLAATTAATNYVTPTNGPKCPKFGSVMKMVCRKRDAKNMILYWRCLVCGSFRSPYDQIFFSLFKRPVKIILAIFKNRSANLTIAKTTSMVDGRNKIVEIDQFLYAKVKHIKGKDLKRPQVWTFNLLQRLDNVTGKKCYLQVVPNRKRKLFWKKSMINIYLIQLFIRTVGPQLVRKVELIQALKCNHTWMSTFGVTTTVSMMTVFSAMDF
ncbi:hypothetical protein BpHYR1_031816 [Brachionus plicatilis]|uniref:Uncharacterized protein n=1 Tax=Brachionus plicatilis TaxID=10195 RepID=A0A3M7Q2E3_BRAPC|nr:hypothetical protein BpHYR1_031816 [Brachionus plicatilis]